MSKSPKFSATVVNPVSPTDNEGDPEGVNLNNFFSLMNKSGSSYIFTPCRDFLPAKSVNARLPPQPVLNKSGNPRRGPDGKIIYQPASKWLDRNRPIEVVTWAPGFPLQIPDRLISQGGWIERKGVSCFNLYRPPRITLGDASKAKFWIDHLRKIYPDDADHIIKWLAHRVQRPGDKHGGFEHVAAYLATEVDLSGFDPMAPPPKTPAWHEIVNVGCPPEDAEIADVIDSLSEPDESGEMASPEAVTIPELIAAAKGETSEWLINRGNRKSLPHRLARCGYVVVPNPDRPKDGLWKCNDTRQAIYARSDLSPEKRLKAARKKADP